MKRFYASRSPVPESWEAEHTDIVREITARGMVLLENRGGLPLAQGSKVALYGYGARSTAYCGYGAASINSRVNVNIEQGLLDAGLQVTTGAYLDRYETAIKEEEEEYFRNIRAIGGSLFDRLVKMYSEQFTPVCQLPITSADVAASETDTAIFVITRVSGEEDDRQCVPGDYYLSDGEKANLQFLSEHYSRVVVLLNVVGQIDMGFIKTLPNLGAVLFVGLNGGVTGSAAADVITGKVTPEGKLASTWAKRYDDFPNSHTFGRMDGQIDDEVYSEGIYVGYRYFDSFGISPEYPFGYGLSYTEFETEPLPAQIEGDRIKISVRVTNRGSFSGRETIQLYVSCPWGKLEQPAQRLSGFGKTGLLAPDESEILTFEADMASLASYDEEINSWVLEKGDYILRVGNSSRNTRPVGMVRIGEDAVLEKCCPFETKSRIENPFAPKREQSIYYAEKLPDNLSILNWKNVKQPATYTYKKRISETAVFDDEVFIARCAGQSYSFQQLLQGECTAAEMVASMSEEELVLLCVGNVDADSGSSGGSLVCASDDTGTDMGSEVPREVVVGASYTTAALLKSRKLPNMPMADGGCGIRLLPEYEMDDSGKLLTAGISAIKNGGRLLNETEKAFFADAPKGPRYWQYTTALPMAVILAQTWDSNCWRLVGLLEQKEMARFGLKLWLAPGMNIHRNPLCGRNFEYYSEDPLLTGLCAARVIDGIQSQGTEGTTIKHIACNNQEANRGGMNAQVSERALREIYLKGYEIAVREAAPTAMMTGHNLVNGVNAAESYDILTTAAREEWGFDGLVMTDWGTTQKHGRQQKYGPSDCDTCMKAGTDLIMPGSVADQQELHTALKSGTLSLENLRWCAWNVLKVFEKLYGG